MICKPGIDIEVTHDFMDLEDVKGFLAGNTIEVRRRAIGRRAAKAKSTALEIPRSDCSS
jgi:hypothetical protein